MRRQAKLSERREARLSERRKARGSYHGIIQALRDWVPGLVVFDMSVICMMFPVADSPSVVRHQDGCVCDVSDKIIQPSVIAEALVATVQRTHTPPLDSQRPAATPLKRVSQLFCSSRQALPQTGQGHVISVQSRTMLGRMGRVGNYVT